MKELRLPYALDSDGNLVHIDDAQKGYKYTCPSCGVELLLKISQIPEGEKYHRRNHYAHRGNSDNHCSESFLHKLFKERCAEYLRNKISAKASVPFEWECKKCGDTHSGNLLKKAVRVETEFNLGVCQPDVALLDKDGNVVIAIEVVVAHSPEFAALTYYNENKIACLQINVEDFPDCDNIEEKLSHPDKVNLCPNPICEKCGRIMNRPKLAIYAGRCWKCESDMKVAMITSSKCILYPRDFNADDIKLAQSMGVILQMQYSKTVNETYLANTCGRCKKFVGDFHLHEYHMFEKPQKTVDLGFRCFGCIEDERRAKEEEARQKEERIMKLRLMEASKFCPKCGGGLKVREGKNGHFWGCKNYPQCTYAENIKDL